MDIATIRAKIRTKQYLIYDHAVTEAFKDGLSIADLLKAILEGEIIEEYPQRKRYLIYGTLDNGIPVHISIDYHFKELHIVTAYIPDRRKWIAFRNRKPRIRK